MVSVASQFGDAGPFFLPSLGTGLKNYRHKMKRIIGFLFGVILIIGAAAVFCLKQNSIDMRSSKAASPLPDFDQIKRQADSGDAKSQSLLGDIYAEGKQLRHDYKEAASWYRKAAEQGFPKAQYDLAVLYDIGQGIAKDEVAAAQWYRKAAEQGNSDAQYTLAGMYGVGRGIDRDPKEALKWYERAAEQGEALASFNLAERYERGKDVSVDIVEAYKWYCLAADRGLADAASTKKNLEHRLTSEQLAAARKRLREFTDKFSQKSGK